MTSTFKHPKGFLLVPFLFRARAASNQIATAPVKDVGPEELQTLDFFQKP